MTKGLGPSFRGDCPLRDECEAISTSASEMHDRIIELVKLLSDEMDRTTYLSKKIKILEMGIAAMSGELFFKDRRVVKP